MTKNYLSYKALKKSFALKVVFLLVILGIIFTVVLVRFALSGTPMDFANRPPNSDEAYHVAKEFVKPGIKSSVVNFPESGYQCAQKPDSVYIIKSYLEAKKQSGEKSIVSFVITMRFNGGRASDKKSWRLLGLIEN